MTSIEWTRGDDGSEGKTWNPTRGCSRVSPGCDNCYAMRVAHRFSGPGKPYDGLTRIGKRGVDWSGRVRLVPEMLDVPLRWRKPRRVFVNSMSDLFHESLSNEEIAAVFGVMAACPQHTFQVLTKRAKRMREWFETAGTQTLSWLWQSAVNACDGHAQRESMTDRLRTGTTWPLPNVWIGVSAENQATADERIPHLLATPAAVRFVSCEPLIGPVDLTRIVESFHPGPPPSSVEFDGLRGFCGATPAEDTPAVRGLQWVIVGGESGPGARPYDLAWPRDIIRQCRESGVAVFHKQVGAQPVDHEPGTDPEPLRSAILRAGRLVRLADRKGGDPSEWPEDLRVREFPAT